MNLDTPAVLEIAALIFGAGIFYYQFKESVRQQKALWRRITEFDHRERMHHVKVLILITLLAKSMPESQTTRDAISKILAEENENPSNLAEEP